MNKVILIGRNTKKPETKYTQGQNPTAISRGTLAVDRKYKRDGEPTADFINFVAFGKTAEFIEKYFDKGSKMVIEGRIQTGSYEKDGRTVYTTDVVVEAVEFGESKASNDSQPAPVGPADGFTSIPEGIDEDLPFATPQR